MVMAARTAAKSMAGREAGSRRSLGCVPACALLFAALAGLGQLAVALGEDLVVAAGELVVGRDVADGAVQADVCCNG